MQSGCRNTRSSPLKETGRQHVRHADQDSEVEVLKDAGDEFFGSIFSLDRVQHSEPQNGGLSTPAVKVLVTIEDIDFPMEKDTGAGASILSYAEYERHFMYVALRPVDSSFHAYAGTPLDIAGQIIVDVEHNGQRATLPLLAVRAERYALPLLKRSWMPKSVWSGKVFFPLQLVSSWWNKITTYGYDALTSGTQRYSSPN